MIFRFWRKPAAPAARKPTRASSNFGGMQVRELQIRLELLVDPTLRTYRDIHRVAVLLAEYSLVEQNRFLASVARLAAQNTELAYRFCCAAVPALTVLPDHAWHPWLEDILQAAIHHGMVAAEALIDGFNERGARLDGVPGAVSFAEIAGIMEVFVRGLSNRRFQLTAGESPFTDTQTMFFPERVERYTDREANFRLFKAHAAHQWAQSQFGTWAVDPKPSLASFPDPGRALRLFHRLETFRLDACIVRELPGVARDMQQFRTADHTHVHDWQAAARALGAPEATVEDSLSWVHRVYPADNDPLPAEYQNVLEPARYARDNANIHQQAPALNASDPKELPEPSSGDAFDDAPPAAPTKSDAPSESEEFRYDEWDQARQCYREQWCRLREQPVAAEPNAFRAQTLDKYSALLARLRRTFEALRHDPRPMRRETNGADIDLDALVESLTDWRAGMELNDRIFISTRHERANMATLFLLDLSASTRGWVNTVEREALVLLCESLELLGDRYAVYGFSGRGHEHCTSYPIKEFPEAYGETVWHRIGAIESRDYTRMGVAIRHHSAKLMTVEARTRLIVVLSDGRPDDEGGYRGAYGIEDTRKALMETRQAGIHPFCITIDDHAMDYLPHMFGRDNFVVVDQVEKLPFRIGEIYRKLIT